MPAPAKPSSIIVEKIAAQADPRGMVFEPIDLEHIRAQQNVHVVLTQPGAIRGNHYHVRGTEISVILGPALVRVREAGETREIEVPAGEVWRFTFPPGVSHAMQNNGVAAQFMVAFNTLPHDRNNPDVVRDVILS